MGAQITRSNQTRKTTKNRSPQSFSCENLKGYRPNCLFYGLLTPMNLLNDAICVNSNFYFFLPGKFTRQITSLMLK